MGRDQGLLMDAIEGSGEGRGGTRKDTSVRMEGRNEPRRRRQYLGRWVRAGQKEEEKAEEKRIE